MRHILIVEDDAGLREGISLALGREVYTFTQCGTIQEAERILLEEEPDLVLLDINLPDGSGYELLKRVKRNLECPVIILTANDLELDEVRGLTLGADDYITKPFSLMVLRARIEKVFRDKRGSERTRYRFGELFFDFADMRFLKGEREIFLSRTEQKLLQLLVENEGTVMTREKLTDHIWDGSEYVERNALSVAVGRLRGKLEENGTDPEYLHTVYGHGYVWKRR